MTNTCAHEEMSPLLSVVIPFHDVEEYLAQTLASVRDQLLADIEVIMIDDGSSDGSPDIARRFVDQDHRFRLVRQQNLGVGPARTRGADEARGQYLTFVDGDDLVPPRAYTTMVSTAQRTGSDVVAGNAKRFSAARGSYQSWTHAAPFAGDQLSTTLAKRPDLVRDRMVWNKVYRMDFWRRGGFSFPAMRYEDYPVVLDVYLEASRVDVLSEHVYFWRDRESGTSITQQRADLANARDRHRSAVMLFDLVNRREAPAQVLRTLESYLARVDIVSLAETMVRVPEAERPEAEALAQDLADRIDPSGVEDQTRISALLHLSLRRRKMPLARALARWRAGGSATDLARDVARTRDAGAAASVAQAFLSAKAPQHPLQTRRLRSTLHEVRHDGDTLCIVVDTTLKPSFAHRARVAAAWPKAAATRGSNLPKLTVAQVETKPWGVRTHLELDLRTVDRPVTGANGCQALGPMIMRLAVGAGAIRWAGDVTVEPSTLPGPVPAPNAVGSDCLVQVIGSPAFSVELLDSRTAPAIQVMSEGDVFVLTLPDSLDEDAPVIVNRPAPTNAYSLAGTAGRRLIHPAQVLAGDVADDVVTGIYEREISMNVAGTPTSFLLTGEACRLPFDGGVVEVTRNLKGRAVLRRTPWRAQGSVTGTDALSGPTPQKPTPSE